jgi:hypothetical protein
MRKRRTTITIVGAALYLLGAGAAHAQIPGSGPMPVITVPGSQVQDQPVEQNTAGILQQDTITATSVSTGVSSPAYQPNTQVIASLDQAVFGNISAQSFSKLFPGWQKFPQDSTDYVAQQVATTLAVYQNVLGVAQRQSQELEGEDFSQVTNELRSQAVLGVLQGIGDAIMADVQQKRMDRQLHIAEITLLATQAGQQLDAPAEEQATATNQPILFGGWGQ